MFTDPEFCRLMAASISKRISDPALATAVFQIAYAAYSEAYTEREEQERKLNDDDRCAYVDFLKGADHA
jgi:hypothetical protein